VSLHSLMTLFDAKPQAGVEECLFSQQLTYIIRDNDLNKVTLLSNHLSDLADEFNVNGSASKLQLCMALQEAITNAIVHGNLEIPSQIKERGDHEFQTMVEERQSQAPYSDRVVVISAMFRQAFCQISVKDEGNGFDPETIADPTHDDNLSKPYGRGLMMIKAFCDEVHFNLTGNEIRMIKRDEG